MTSLRSSPPPPDLSLEEAIFDGSRSEKTEMRRSFVDSSSTRRWVELGINHRLTIMEYIVKLINLWKQVYSVCFQQVMMSNKRFDWGLGTVTCLAAMCFV